MLTREKVTTTIKRRLGYPQVDVELADEHYEEILDEADRWFLTFVSPHDLKEATTTFAAGQQEIDVEADCAVVMEVYFPSKSYDYLASLSQGFFVDDGRPPLYTTDMTSGFYTDTAMFLQHQKTAMRVMGYEREWEWVPSKRKIRLLPISSTKGGGTLVYTYTSRNLDFETMTPFQEGLYIRRALVEAKRILGRIRGKVDGYPAPGGGTISLDGKDLLAEAETEMEKLTEEVQGLPLPMFVG